MSTSDKITLFFAIAMWLTGLGYIVIKDDPVMGLLMIILMMTFLGAVKK